jgi:primosomal protein N' (replication factor Y)
MLKRGWLIRVEEPEFREDDYAQYPEPIATSPEPTVMQASALEQILAPRGFLLHGVTGSGKTEVYLRAIEEALRLGRTGLVLVPEISLTPQTVNVFRARLGPVAAVYHSRLTLGQKYDLWKRIQSGEAC